MPAGETGKRRILNATELAILTETWAIWVEDAATPARRLARLRLHLFFLLARFGGLRLAEISYFDPGWIDIATGYLRVGDRALFLPSGAMRFFRRILSLEEAQKPGFLKLDAGFLRRAFYTVADFASLPPALCAPRALRYARALELAGAGMPLEFIAKALGFKHLLQLANLLKSQEMDPCRAGKDDCNATTGLILRIETGQSCGRLLIELAGRIYLQAIRPLAELPAIEPQPGRTVRLYIPPACIFPADVFPDCANRLDCALLALVYDQLEVQLQLSIANLKLAAVMSPFVTDFTNYKAGQNFTIHIPPHLIQLS